MNLPLAVETFNQAMAQGHTINPDTFHNLLSLVAGLGDQGSGSGPPRECDPPHDLNAATMIFQEMKALNIPLSESNYTAMIRCYSINQRPLDALELYREMTAMATELTSEDQTEAADLANEVTQPSEESNDGAAIEDPTVIHQRIHRCTPKLRTFTPMLAAFATLGDADTCFSLYHDIVHQYNLPLMEREYLSLLRAATSSGSAHRFHDTLQQMMEDVLEPTVEHAWPVFREWFANNSDYLVFESKVQDDGEVVPIDPSIDSAIGSHSKLLSIELDLDTKAQLLQQIESFALNRAYIRTTPQQQATATVVTASKGNNEGDAPKLSKQEVKWRSFKSWLQGTLHKFNDGDAFRPEVELSSAEAPSADHRLFNIVVDGANVGYYKQNYAGAPTHVDYNQIDSLVRQLQGRGYRPLLILHARHVHEDKLPAQFAPIVNRWRQEKLLFITPSGWNDDWFWLYTAVSLDCHIVTNDEMRDHHFQMLSPRWFCRWKERHQVHFKFGKWIPLPGLIQPGAVALGQSPDDDADDPDTQDHEDGDDLVAAAEQEVAAFVGDVSRKQTSAAFRQSLAVVGGKLKGREALLQVPSVYSRRIQCIVRPGDDIAGGGIEGKPSRSEFYFPGQSSDTWLCAVEIGGIITDGGSLLLGTKQKRVGDTLDKEINSDTSRDKRTKIVDS